MKITKQSSTEIQILDQIAASTKLSRKQVAAVLDGFANSIKARVKENQIGVFTIPGFIKIQTVIKPAVAERRDAINPFTKEQFIIYARPATTVVRVSMLSLRTKPRKTLEDIACGNPNGK